MPKLRNLKVSDLEWISRVMEFAPTPQEYDMLSMRSRRTTATAIGQAFRLDQLRLKRKLDRIQAKVDAMYLRRWGTIE